MVGWQGWLAGKLQGVGGGRSAPTSPTNSCSVCAACTSWPCSPETRQKMSASRKVGLWPGACAPFSPRSLKFSTAGVAHGGMLHYLLPPSTQQQRSTMRCAHHVAYCLLYALDCAHLCTPGILPVGHSGAARRLFFRVAQCPVGSRLPSALEPGRAIPHELLPPQHEVGSVSSAALAEQHSCALCISEQ